MNGHRRPRARAVFSVVALTALAAVAACGDNGPTALKIDAEMEGIYALTDLRFDPQGSAPEANVLPLIQSTHPQLVVSQTGVFQIAFVDPNTHLIRTASGNATRTAAGLRLSFASQEAADELLLPQRLEMAWDADTRTLSYSGLTEVSRARLLELFPVLYADEQLFDPTPGTLTVQFEQESVSAT